LISDRQLRQAIDGLRRLERKSFASRSRFAFSPHQIDHRRDLDRRPQDPKPLDESFALRLARTQNVDRPWIVLTGEWWACRMRETICRAQGRETGYQPCRVPLPRNRSAVFDRPKGRLVFSMSITHEQKPQRISCAVDEALARCVRLPSSGTAAIRRARALPS
jgi:hypothetical protein